VKNDSESTVGKLEASFLFTVVCILNQLFSVHTVLDFCISIILGLHNFKHRHVILQALMGTVDC